MKLTCEDYGQTSVIRVKGDLTADQVEAFRKQARDRIDAQARDLVLDVGGMEFVDSKGLEAVLWLQEQCGEKLGQIRLAAATPNVLKILEITRLAPSIECYPDVDSAMKSLR